jgi:hypothetical protein
MSNAMKWLLTLGKQDKWESDPALNKPSSAAKHHQDDENIMQCMAKIVQHLVDVMDFHYVKMHLLEVFSNSIH